MTLTSQEITVLEGCQAGLSHIEDLYTLLGRKIYGNKETLYSIIDDVVDIAVPILNSLRALSQKNMLIGKAWALTKDILLYANKDPATSSMKKNISIGNMKGAVERIRILQKQIHDAQTILSLVLTPEQKSTQLKKSVATSVA